MLLPASRDAKRIIYGLITLREVKKKQKNLDILLLRLLTSSLFFIQTQRGTLKEITIMNECGMVIEVEQSLKESRGRYNQGL